MEEFITKGLDYNTLVTLNFQIEEAFLKCIAESEVEMNREDFLKLIALFSSHFVDAMQKNAPEVVNIKALYKDLYNKALDFWQEQPINEYPELLPEVIGEA